MLPPSLAPIKALRVKARASSFMVSSRTLASTAAVSTGSAVTTNVKCWNEVPTPAGHEQEFLSVVGQKWSQMFPNAKLISIQTIESAPSFPDDIQDDDDADFGQVRANGPCYWHYELLVEFRNWTDFSPQCRSFSLLKHFLEQECGGHPGTLSANKWYLGKLVICEEDPLGVPIPSTVKHLKVLPLFGDISLENKAISEYTTDNGRKIKYLQIRMLSAAGIDATAPVAPPTSPSKRCKLVRASDPEDTVEDNNTIITALSSATSISF